MYVQGNKNELTRIFTHAAHKGVVKSLASAGPYVASGGADDLIHLYDMRSNTDLGFLMNPGEGAITALEFFVPRTGYSPTNLLAGCADGTISIWQSGGTWECMRTLKGHRGEVTSIAVHPSGYLALTAARDGTLRLWDLVKGRATFTTKVDGVVELVKFAPSGNFYAIVCGNTVTLKALSLDENETNSVSFEHESKVNSAAWGNGDNILITGLEDGSIHVWSVKDKKQVASIPNAHFRRIKSIAFPHNFKIDETKSKSDRKIRKNKKNLNEIYQEIPILLATACSDGVIKLWRLQDIVQNILERQIPSKDSKGTENTFECLCSTATRSRMTVLVAVDTPEIMEKKIQEEVEISRIQKKKRKKLKKQKFTEVKSNQHQKATIDEKITTGDPDLSTKIAKKVKMPKQHEKQSKRNRQQDVSTPRNGREYVDFMDEKDAERDRKKKKKIMIQAERAARRTDKNSRTLRK